jgi:uncharacterized membrane protein YeiB
VIANLVYVIAGHWSDRSDPSPQLILMLIGQTFGAPALSIFYMTSLILLVQAANWEHRLQPLASVGRMEISNHLLQTLICTTLFYGCCSMAMALGCMARSAPPRRGVISCQQKNRRQRLPIRRSIRRGS